MTILPPPALQFITDFADQAVVLPATLVVALALCALGWWRGALAWLATVAASFGSILLLKLAFQGCGSPLPHHLMRSPSGHTMAATILYGGLLVIAGLRRWRAALAAILIAAAIGATRLALAVHTVPEVLLGGMIGIAGVALFSRLLDRIAPPPRRASTVYRWLPFTLALLPVLLLHGQRSRVEASIHDFAAHYVSVLLGCRRDGNG